MFFAQEYGHVMESTQQKFLFICGLHRSGTTILHHVLNDHSGVSGFENTGVFDNEGQYLQTVFPNTDELGGPGYFGFDENATHTEPSSLNTSENQAKLWAEWSKHWLTTKPVLLEKSPTNLLNTRLLQAYFPNSYFILIMRHPIAVTYATQRVTGNGRYNISLLDSMLAHWVHCHQLFRADADSLRNVHIIHYEKFVKKPAETMAKIYDFIGLTPESLQKEIYKTTNQKYYNRWYSKSQSTFARYNMQALVRKYEFQINQFGYSLINVDENVDTPPLFV